ncbi:Mas-related G-protein coupled receptor member D [Bacillus sp. WMMC1349]|nr:Mas-related G-protein coupled receptor member D [Bacillus sp. WMMC1349]
MDIVFFLIAVLALGLTFTTFIAIILNDGLGSSSFSLKKKSVKFMISSFAMYIIFYAFFILMQI